jgi:hypothetical protein
MFQRFNAVKILALFNTLPDSSWLYLSLLAPLYYGLISAYYSISQDYIVQDDARNHMVWLQRFVDPQLFPNDLIANYYLTVEPIGYKIFYWLMAKVGIQPTLLNTVAPTLLGIIATVYLFLLFLKILPIPAGAFLTTLIFNQQLWLRDDLVSLSPRAFLYPFFAAFLYYLVNKSLLPCLATIALQGLFFPPHMFIEVAILTIRLFYGSERFLKLSKQKEDYIFWLTGLLVALASLLPFTLTMSEVGPVITAAQMKTMPEYGSLGRLRFFGFNPFQFIFMGNSGLGLPIFPSIIWIGFGLPPLLKFQFPLARFITAELRIVTQIVLASLSLFSLAYLFLLQLFFPNRYTYHSARFVLAIASGIVLTVLLEAGWRWLQRKRQANFQFNAREWLLIRLTAFLAAVVIIVPAIPPLFFVEQGWVIGEAPEIYRYLANQPKETLIASLADDGTNLPAFAQRSTLVSREFALPYHPNYYNQIKQRIVDLIHIQYGSDLSESRQLMSNYGIDFLLVERNAFNPKYLSTKDWLIQSSFQSVVLEAIARLEQREQPALRQFVDSCSVVSTQTLILLETACINKTDKVRVDPECLTQIAKKELRYRLERDKG